MSSKNEIANDKIASFIVDVSPFYTGEAKCFRVTPKMKTLRGAETEYVVVAASEKKIIGRDQTAIFPSDSRGNVETYLPIKTFHFVDIVQALGDMGYETKF